MRRYLIVVAGLVCVMAATTGLLYATSFQGDPCIGTFNACAELMGSPYVYANAEGQCLALNSLPSPTSASKCEIVSLTSGGISFRPLFDSLGNGSYNCEEATTWAKVRAVRAGACCARLAFLLLVGVGQRKKERKKERKEKKKHPP